MQIKKFKSDVDMDFADRDQILRLIRATPARLEDGSRHNSGVYVTEIPVDPVRGISALDYHTAEELGYFKLDFLNVNIYREIRDETHLIKLMTQEPDWVRFNNDPDFFQQLMHVNLHWSLLKRMPEPVDSIPRLAMFLAVIRPARRHLAGKTWAQVNQTVWDRSDDTGYAFKRSHAIAYAHLVVVNMNLLCEQE
jgi:hypothetical protein